MKILLSARRFSQPLVGGVDVYADRLARAFRRMGHDVGILAYDDGNCGKLLSNRGPSSAIDVLQETRDDYSIWRLSFDGAQRPKEAFDHAYDPEMGRVLRGILQQENPDRLVVLNFYLATLALVEAAVEVRDPRLRIPVAHVATDFIPVCRRATFMRWDDSPCEQGESIKSCAACFVSHHPLGRLAARTLGALPEQTLLALAGEDGTDRAIFGSLPNPLALLNPYWKQVRIMQQRLAILGSLRHQIDVVLAPTSFTRQMFIANGFRPQQVHLLPFAVEARDPRLDPPQTRVKHTLADHTRFLFVGRLQPYKGAHLLIEAFNRLDNPQCATLTIYGAPAAGYESYFQGLQKQMAANSAISFKGTIPPDQLGHAFAEADYFVLPSTWHENSPLILLDALQSKTPVIATEIGGVTDIVKHGVNGLLFPRADAAREMVAGLQRVLQQAIDERHGGVDAAGQTLRAGANLPLIDDYARALLQKFESQNSEI